MRPISVSTALFDGYPVERGFAEIADAGVRFVEPAFIKGYVDFDEETFTERSAAAYASAITAAGLSSFAVSAHHDMGAPGAADATIGRLRFAAGVGARILITNSTRAADVDAFRRNLDEVLPVAEETGVVIALENPGHGSGDLIGSAADGVRLLLSIASPHVRLNYDFGNVLTYSGERIRPETDCEAALSFMAHAHLKDVLSLANAWQFTAIGDGSIDYAAIWSLLAKRAPDLPVGLELPLRLTRPERAPPRRAVEPLPLAVLRNALKRSLDFIEAVDMPLNKADTGAA